MVGWKLFLLCFIFIDSLDKCLSVCLHLYRQFLTRCASFLVASSRRIPFLFLLVHVSPLCPHLPTAVLGQFSARRWPPIRELQPLLHMAIMGVTLRSGCFESARGRWLWGLGGLQSLPEAPRAIIRAYGEVLPPPSQAGVAPNEGGWAGLLCSQKPRLS